MDWLVENGFWVLIGIVFIAMHLFGHGGHGAHGGHNNNSATDRDATGADPGDSKAGHRH